MYALSLYTISHRFMLSLLPHNRLMKQRSECEGITEKLKAESPMLWVGSMNALREAVTETVNAEVSFV